MEEIFGKIKILYEDENVLAINKPAGLVVHSDGRNIELSVADWVLKNFPALKDVGEPWISPQGENILRPGIVHRLDKQTSGVMLIAKNQESHSFLKNQFQKREIEKMYRAFVYGHLKEKSGVIEMEIGRTKSIPRKWIALPAGPPRPRSEASKKGQTGTLREAITHWQVLKLGQDLETGEKITFLEARPKTGRTHQIRVHFKAIGHPVVCDHIYAAKKPCLLGFNRLALHAFQIRFQTPDHLPTATSAAQAGKTLEIEAPFPEDFERALYFLSAL